MTRSSGGFVFISFKMWDVGILNVEDMRYIYVVNLQTCMPMKYNSTHLSTTEFAALVRRAAKQEEVLQPQMSSIRFLKNFARNYRANVTMPQGLQNYMLS